MSQSPPPPPPPGGYGSPPPPPSGGGGYGGPPESGGHPGGPPAGGPPWSVGNAVSYGWTKLQANLGQILIAGLVVFVGLAIFQGVGYVIREILTDDPECRGTSFNTLECDDGSGFFVALLATAISSLLFFVIYQVIGAGIIRGSLGVTEGRSFEFTEIFRTDRIGRVIVTSLITSAIIAVGFLLCVLPGIIAAFLLSYSLYFVIDQDMEPMAAIRASFSLVKDNLGEALVWAIVSYLIVVAGVLLCLVGLIAAIPISLLGTAYTYKKLTGQPVAA